MQQRMTITLANHAKLSNTWNTVIGPEVETWSKHNQSKLFSKTDMETRWQRVGLFSLRRSPEIILPPQRASASVGTYLVITMYGNPGGICCRAARDADYPVMHGTSTQQRIIHSKFSIAPTLRNAKLDPSLGFIHSFFHAIWEFFYENKVNWGNRKKKKQDVAKERVLVIDLNTRMQSCLKLEAVPFDLPKYMAQYIFLYV